MVTAIFGMSPYDLRFRSIAPRSSGEGMYLICAEAVLALVLVDAVLEQAVYAGLAGRISG
ncbi:hypothetical protein [Methanofollis ethanolicus]|uniref:hypothetical protein n=1 Tax=Methanofollis ethanolicus TaxID=488124 RepID=UPI000830894A|nr:hypothetical protein [Methanofollis ethanolicus]